MGELDKPYEAQNYYKRALEICENIYNSNHPNLTSVNNRLNLINGKIVKIQIKCSASTDFKIYCDASDDGTQSLVDEYILGTSGATVTVNTELNIYPVAVREIAAGTGITTTANIYEQFHVNEALQVDVTNLTAADTYQVRIWYDQSD